MKFKGCPKLTLAGRAGRPERVKKGLPVMEMELIVRVPPPALPMLI